MKAKIAVLILLLATFWAAAQRLPKRPDSPPPAISEVPARASQADLQKMRNLVQQMQMNLVSLPPGPTPLRHQFELEIEMWQTLISHLESQSATPRTPQPEH